MEFESKYIARLCEKEAVRGVKWLPQYTFPFLQVHEPMVSPEGASILKSDLE